MRKAISGVGQLIGILIAIAGLIVAMCDTADLDKQIITMFAGLVIFCCNLLICWTTLCMSLGKYIFK